MRECALLDTSFFIRLLNEEGELHEAAKGFYKYLLNNGIQLAISTIAIAEYCVRREFSDLPMLNLLVVPFNIMHAKRAGTFANIVYENKQKQDIQITSRIIIPNDTKMFAQADEEKMKYFISADTEAKKVYNVIKEHTNVSFQFIDIRKDTVNTVFSELFV